MNKEDNLKIIELLQDIIEKHPELRFCQILANAGIEGEMYYYNATYVIARLEDFYYNK